MKMKKPRARVAVHVKVAWSLYPSRTSCAGWDGVHLPGGCHLCVQRVPMSPMLQEGRAQRKEIGRRWGLLPLNLLADPPYDFYLPVWDTFVKEE
jgi:hypothetical protein